MKYSNFDICPFGNTMAFIYEEIVKIKKNPSLAKEHFPWMTNPQLKQYWPVKIGSNAYMGIFEDESN